MTDKETLAYANMFFRSRISRLSELMDNVALYKRLPADDEQLIEPYCDDYAGCDTINMCFQAGLLDQIGSEDDFSIIITEDGRRFMESLL